METTVATVSRADFDKLKYVYLVAWPLGVRGGTLRHESVRFRVFTLCVVFWGSGVYGLA